MTEHLESTLHSENLLNNTSNSDGVASDLRVNYEYNNDGEKPILLELGVTSNRPRSPSEHNIIPYANHYPLDLHINSAFGSVFPTFPHAYSIDPALLFNNPYSNRTPTTASQISQDSTPHSTASLISRNALHYSSHIPQPVYTWSAPPAVTNITQNDVKNELITETVPPPSYMTYPDTCELTITKRSNHLRKEKPLQTERDYKKTACDRERTRMRDMNKAFDLLRSKLPISKPNGKKYSKIESLRIAINYINHLKKILEENTTDEINLTGSKYLNEINLRTPSNLYHFANHKSNCFEDVNDRFENFDESRSTWSDGYIPNSQDKWE